MVGAGAAGLVAAHELRRAGHAVVVFEDSGHVGGRTRTVRFADDHLLDAGAAWLTSFYRNALGYASGLPMLSRDVAGTPRLRLMGRPGAPAAAAPFGPAALASSKLLTWQEKARMVAWVIRNAAHGPHVGPRPGPVQHHDSVDAATYARRHLGEGVLECVLRPAFETMVFAPVDELSAAFVGNWAGAALVASYQVPADGMDAPWRRLASRLDVRLHHKVVAVEVERPWGTTSAGVSVRFVARGHDARGATEPADAQQSHPRVTPDTPPADAQDMQQQIITAPEPEVTQEPEPDVSEEHFDGVVVAAPAPIAARIVRQGRPGRPAWLDDVRYAQHVFGYGARPATAARAGGRPSARRVGPTDIHPAGHGAHRIGSVQILPGGDGRVPPGWEAAVVSATGPWSEELLRQEAKRESSQRDDDALFEALWRDGMALEPGLFPAADCSVRHVVRWRHAVPIFEPGLLTRLATWRPSAPIALAGDWSWYPCIEGAVISGQRAAAALLGGG